MTIEQTLQFWFLVLYAMGAVGFLSNVMRVRVLDPRLKNKFGRCLQWTH
jgi:hypothetical protein